MAKPILCLDFDGVIHSYTSGWQGAHVVSDPPVPGAITFMLAALHHFSVAIFSSRSRQPGGLPAMREWLRNHAGAAWYPSPDGPGLESVVFVEEKPSAFVTIDDRAVTFTGAWPSIESLLAFQPWNKRPAPTGPRYRKKPVVIEAVQWDGQNILTPGIPPWLYDVFYSNVVWSECSHLVIKTLEGSMVCNKGDFIIRGVKGEIYPCKPDIFAATYEPVE